MDYRLDCSLPFWFPLFSSWSPLFPSSLFSSLCNCEPLWVSLTVVNLFTINLDVLSLVLYGWRSLEATVRIRLKTRVRRLECKTWEPENSWLQGTLIDKSSSKSLHTYIETKFHPRANKFQSKTYQANSPTMQVHNPEHKNTAKSHTKPTDTSQFTTGHFIALQREEIQLHPPEHRSKLP